MTVPCAPVSGHGSVLKRLLGAERDTVHTGLRERDGLSEGSYAGTDLGRSRAGVGGEQ